MDNRLVTFVLPTFNEQDNLHRLFDELSALDERLANVDLEFVFVNDGSRDDSLSVLRGLAARDPRVSVIDFSRNFGHQMAVTAGLDLARGDAVIVMDADLQDPPAVSIEMIQRWREGYDVVYAQRRSRKDSLFKRVTAGIYYWLLQRLADVSIPRNAGDFRLMDRAVVDQLKLMRERNRFLRGMVSFVGFRQIAVRFDRDERHAGVTGYPLGKMLKFAADGVMSFSTAPLRLISVMGYLFSALSFLGIIYALLMKVLRPDVTIEGWTFIVISVLLSGGVQMVMVGVLGSYIGRIYAEVQGRPLYITREIIGPVGKVARQ